MSRKHCSEDVEWAPLRFDCRLTSTSASRALAKSNSISVNKLMDRLAMVALANYDARLRFETRAARGNPKRALALFDKLDRAG